MTLSEQLQQLEAHASRLIVGQSHLINRMLIALLCDGHLLVEGAPGLAKTRAIKVLSHSVEGDFHRLQFTPDLLPADLTGTDVYRPQDGSFAFQPGPLFHNIILADEVNRAPAKVQSALLEAMEERQITVGQTTHALPALFLVMATQNPLEHDGTYALPEAQLDRFLFKVDVHYPAPDKERDILELGRAEARASAGRGGDGDTEAAHPLTAADVEQARDAVMQVHMADAVEQYLLDLVLATRSPAEGDLERWLALGASPRATLGLDRAARAHAWLDGRDYVIPEDVAETVADVLCHRLLLTFEARSEGLTGRDVVARLKDSVQAP